MLYQDSVHFKLFPKVVTGEKRNKLPVDSVGLPMPYTLKGRIKARVLASEKK